MSQAPAEAPADAQGPTVRKLTFNADATEDVLFEVLYNGEVFSCEPYTALEALMTLPADRQSEAFAIFREHLGDVDNKIPANKLMAAFLGLVQMMEQEGERLKKAMSALQTPLGPMDVELPNGGN